MDKELTHIMCAPDDNYAMHCGAMLESLFQNNKEIRFFIHVCYCDLSKKNIRQLNRIISSHGGKSKYYDMSTTMAMYKFPLTGHFTISTYIRLFLAETLSSAITKVTYLDCDLIIRSSVKPLVSKDLTSYALAAVVEPRLKGHGSGLGLSGNYFNAGVAVLNLEYWRKSSVSNTAVEIVQKRAEELIYVDQDVLNIALDGKWLPLDRCWNVNHHYFSDAYDHKTLELSETEYETIKNDPAILHFSGHLKPWDYYSQHPWKAEYFKYLNDTPWKGFKGYRAPSLWKRAKEKSQLLASDALTKLLRAIKTI